MSDLRKLARIILVGLGIYVLVNHGIGVVAILPGIFYGELSLGVYGIARFISVAIMTVCIGLVIYVLICKADSMSAKMTDVYESDQAKVWWLPFAFRLAMVCAGIIVLSWSISAIASTIASYAKMMSHGPSRESMPWQRFIQWQRIVGWVIQLILAIYLICGAPHFVRWQVSKTLEHC
ncbi:MAG: hypothetical protein JRC93_13815, partial [Deltaproteobacteria bacterium]|nr:hypothetical protein [Deltaproteobacteria bacterium]